MWRGGFAGGALLLSVLLGLGPATAQEPIVFGVITPLSPPGETALGQLAKRGARDRAPSTSMKRAACSAAKSPCRCRTAPVRTSRPLPPIAGWCRAKRPSRCSASFIRGANIAVNEVAKEMGVPTMGTQTGASDVTAKHYDIAFRTHAVDPPRAATWLGWAKKNSFKRVASSRRPRTTASVSPRRPRSRTRQEPRSRDPDHHVRSHHHRSAAATLAGQGVQARRHHQCRCRPAARPDDHAGYTVGLLPGAPW